MATITPSKILVFGATGQIGKYIVEALLDAKPPFPQVTAFTSPATVAAKADTLEAWKARGLSVLAGDVTDEAQVKKAYAGIDVVVSCVGRNVLKHQENLAQWAEESGVGWFFPSEYGTDIEFGPASAGEKVHQVKLAVRRDLRARKKLRHTFLVTGPYADMFFQYYKGLEAVGGFDVTTKEAYLVGDGEWKVGLTTMPDVGKAVVAALRHPEASQNRAVVVQSFVTTPHAILGEFEKQTGSRWKVVGTTSLDELREQEAKAWKAGSPSAALLSLRRIWAEGGTLYEKTGNEAIGLAPKDLETLADVVGRAV